MNSKELIDIAVSAMKKAYAPYSHFKVGAALLCSDGSVYEGCNIENAAFTPTVCAERVAFFSAVRDGHRDFSEIAVVGGMDGNITSFTYPCGVCRQVMREFCRGDFTIAVTDGNTLEKLTLDKLLPYSFSPDDLNI